MWAVPVVESRGRRLARGVLGRSSHPVEEDDHPPRPTAGSAASRLQDAGEDAAIGGLKPDLFRVA